MAVFQLSHESKNNDNNSSLTYQLSKTIRNKIVNYKEAVNCLHVDEDVSFSLYTDQCDCADSCLCGPHHKHIIAGDFRIIKKYYETSRKRSKL